MRSYHRLHDTATARTAYQAVLDQFPNSNKRDDAQYRIGMTYHDDGDTAAELQALNTLVPDYPTSDRVAEAQVHIDDILRPMASH